MKNIEEDVILSRVKKVILEVFPEFNLNIFSRKTPSNSILVETPVEREKGIFYFGICLFFRQDNTFIPSICCGKENPFNSDPGELVHIDDLEKGMKEFLQKHSTEIKSEIEVFSD